MHTYEVVYHSKYQCNFLFFFAPEIETCITDQWKSLTKTNIQHFIYEEFCLCACQQATLKWILFWTRPFAADDHDH